MRGSSVHTFSKRILTLISKNYPDTKINYEAERRFVNLMHRRILRIGQRITDDTILAPGREIPVKIFFPEKNGSFPVLLFFHGGGWVSGSLESYEKVCIQLANRTKRIVVSVGYRLAPENKFPCAAEDCYFVTQYLSKEAIRLGIDLEHVVMAGDSAGGNLAAVVALMAKDRNGFCPQSQILIYPTTAGDRNQTPEQFPSYYENGYNYILTKKRIEDYMELYREKQSDIKNPYYAPLEASNLTNMPKTLIITADLDPLRDEGELFAKKLENAGNHVELHRFANVIHGFLTNGLFPIQTKKLFDIISLFLSEKNLRLQKNISNINRGKNSESAAGGIHG